MCCSPWDHKESDDLTEQLNRTDIYVCVCMCVCVCMYTVFSTSKLFILFTNLFFYQYHIDLMILTFGVCWCLTKTMTDSYDAPFPTLINRGNVYRIR